MMSGMEDQQDGMDTDVEHDLINAVKNDNESEVLRLISTGEDVNQTEGESGKTALFYAVQQSDNESVVRALIDAGADVNTIDKVGKTALFYAVQQKNNQSVVCTLIDAGIDVKKTDNEGKTALFYANKNHNMVMTCELIDAGSDFSISEIDAKGVLLNAVRNGRTEVVRKLIHAGVAVDEIDGEGKNALFEAVCSSDETIVRLLVEEGKAFVNARDLNGRTPLFYAITRSIKISRYLFERAIVNDSDLCSILQFFLENHSRESDTSYPPIDEVLKLLQDNGLTPKRIVKAIVNIVLCKIPLLLTSVTKSHFSRNSIASMRIHWTRKMESLLNVLKEVVSEYVETTMDVNKERVVRMLELIEDAKEDYISGVFSLLKDLGCANRNFADIDGNTAFHNVMRLPFLGVPKETVMDLCERILRLGVPVTKVNHHGETPLLFCLSGSLENLEEEDKSSAMKTLVDVCTFLVNNGSNIEETTKRGESVFHFIMKLFQQGLQIADEAVRKNVIDEALKLLNFFSLKKANKTNIVIKLDCDLNSPLHLWATLAFTASVHNDYTASRFGEYTFEKLLEKIQTYLVRCGALPNPRNINDETPLHLCNTWSAVKLLIKQGANRDDKDSSNRSPLLGAAIRKTFLVYPSHFYPDVQEDAKSFFKTAVSKMKLDPWTDDKDKKSVLGILIEFDTDNLSEALVDVACDGTLSIEEKEFKDIFVSLLIAISRDQSLHALGKVDLARTLLSSAKKRKIHVADEPFDVCCETISRLNNEERPCKKRSSGEQETVQISIAKLLRENGANLKGDSYAKLIDIDPEIDTIITKVEVQEMIRWTSVSTTYKNVLKKVARRQECKEVNSICFCESPVKSGSFGELFVGINKSDSKEVAVIKRLNESSTQPQQEVINRIAHLDCEQVVRYFSHFEVDDSFYITFELMEGNLDDYLSNSCPAFDSRKTLLCKDVVEGLKYLHQQDIVHGYLKPTNIFFKTHPELCLKITYFGKSLFADSTSTNRWMSPERLMNSTNEHSKASDTFSCGLLLHYILSKGKHPFSPTDTTNKSESEIAEKTKDNIKDGRMEEFDNSLSPEASHLVRKMIESTIKNRPTAGKAIDYPLFWTKKKKIDLLIAVANQPEIERPARFHNPTLNADLETNFSTIVKNGTWDDPGYLHMPDIYAEMTRRRSYDTRSLVALVRFIRNAYAHVSEDRRPLHMRNLLLEDFVFLEYFPALVMEVYKAVTTHGWDQREEIKYEMNK